MPANLQSLPPTALAELLSVDQSADQPWSKTEQTQILRHLLSLPVERCTCLSPTTDWQGLAQLRQAAAPPIGSLRQLLDHPTPPQPLLRLVKDFAKFCRDQPDQGIPTEIATALYFVCTAQALLLHHTQITSLDTTNVRQGLQWLAAQTWTDPTWNIYARNALHQL